MNKLITVGSKTYRKENVFEANGHFKEGFFRGELHRFYDRYKTIWEHLRIYRKFKQRYPNLNDWFQEEIPSRVGRDSSDQGKSFQTRLSYRSRWYIYYLSIFGVKLDYPYLFSIRAIDGFTRTSKRYGLDYGFDEIIKTLKRLNYPDYSSFASVRWVVNRIIMHTGKRYYREITLEDMKKFEKQSEKYAQTQHISKFWDHAVKAHIHDKVKTSIFKLHLILYAEKIITETPYIHYERSDMVDRKLDHLKHQKIADVLLRYTKQISLAKEKQTVQKVFMTLHAFIRWLEKNYEEVDTLRNVSRLMVEEYLYYMKNHVSEKTGKILSLTYVSGVTSILKVFFDESLYFGYEDVPQHKLLCNYHLIRRPKSLPRYIPKEDLRTLMKAVLKLECPYQRNVLILLRWTGARREEIRRLDINALDYYSDGTPKLFIPIGKTNTSRWVPIQKEAEQAFKELLEIRTTAGNLTGLVDRKTGQITDYLFMRRNALISGTYLFSHSMKKACQAASLLTEEGKHKYTSHQFRHTIGTEMANKGASLSTIMKMLGHLSPDMTIRYTYIHDETVKKDYQNTIGKETIIAGGEYADRIQKRSLRKEEVDWIKANFHKTYLTMGHCFHHTREAMCDFADACYFCPKFVTTKDHLPKLMDKYEVELQLIEDAKERGWGKEVERHTNVSKRVKKLIYDLERQ
jgi:site-specific recombinase XerD